MMEMKVFFIYFLKTMNWDIDPETLESKYTYYGIGTCHDMKTKVSKI